jgi:hypothetical protein
LEFRPKCVGWGSVLNLIAGFLKHMFEGIREAHLDRLAGTLALLVERLVARLEAQSESLCNI